MVGKESKNIAKSLDIVSFSKIMLVRGLNNKKEIIAQELRATLVITSVKPL